jgi:hypothetical protein
MSNASKSPEDFRSFDVWHAGRLLARFAVSIAPGTDGVLELDIVGGRVEAGYWFASTLDRWKQMAGEAAGSQREGVLLCDVRVARRAANDPE